MRGRVLGKRQTIWLDNNQTQTAADLYEVEHCDAFIRRLSVDIEYLLEQLPTSMNAPRNLEELMASKELSNDIPRNQRQALFYKKQGLLELRKRRNQLSQQG